MKIKNGFVFLFGAIFLISVGFLNGCNSTQDNNNEDDDQEVNVAFATKDAEEVLKNTGVEQWTYVAIGDSVSWNYPHKFSQMLEEDLGINVELKNWTVGGDHSSDLLERIKTDQPIRNDLRSADIITIEIPWKVFRIPCELLSGQYNVDEYEGLSPEENIKKAAEIYKSDTTEILDEIVSLSSPSDTLIRTMDTYQFNVNLTKKAGSFEIINKYWTECNEHLIKEAAQYNIPTVRVYDAFMGESGEEDPGDLGLIYDGFHQTETGSTLIADLFRNVGYHYAPEEQ